MLIFLWATLGAPLPASTAKSLLRQPPYTDWRSLLASSAA